MKRSIYAKVYRVLQIAKSGRDYNGKDGLVNLIEEANLDIFVHSVYLPDKDEMDPRQSRPAIKKSIKWAVEFGFLDVNYRLSQVGRKSLTERGYQSALIEAVKIRLSEAGSGLDRLNRTISKAISAGLNSLPTSKYLYDTLAPNMPRKNFGLYLSVLQDCGSAQICHKKLYLGFK